MRLLNWIRRDSPTAERLIPSNPKSPSRKRQMTLLADLTLAMSRRSPCVALFVRQKTVPSWGVELSRRLPDLHLQCESPASRYVLTSPGEVGDVPSIVDMEAPALSWYDIDVGELAVTNTERGMTS